MSKRLASYLNDHLAGARFAIDLLETLRDQQPQEPLGRLAGELVVEVEQDRQTLRQIASGIGDSGSTLKEASSWLLEKIAPMKLRLGADPELSRYLSVEVLTLGVLGKLALWQALAVLAPADARLGGHDWDRLVARAQSQHQRLETQRLQMAAKIFAP